MIKFGVIGYGFIGRRHVETLKNRRDTACIAICDISEKRRKEAKEAHPEIAVYETADEMLQRDDIDTVLISSNNATHKDLVIQAASAGKHIICEKPAALNAAEFDEMMKAVEENQVLFTVHQQRRYDKDFVKVKKAFEQNLLGNVYTVQSKLFGYNGNMHDWHRFRQEGGGMLYDWGVHLIDQILYMIPGRLVSVYADVKNVINAEVDDYFNILLRFESGITAQIELGTYILRDAPGWFTRHWFMGGDQGSLYCDGFEGIGKIVRTAHLLENVEGEQDKSAVSYGPTRSFGIPEEGLLLTEELPETETDQSFYFENYCRARRGEMDFLVKIPEVRRVLSVMEAVRKSAETALAVPVEKGVEDTDV